MATMTNRPGPGTAAHRPEAPGPSARAPLDADSIARELNHAARAAGSEQAASRAAARIDRDVELRHGTPEARRRRAARTVMLVAVPLALAATALNVVGFGPERVVAPATSIAEPDQSARADLRFVAAAVHAYAARRGALPRALADVSADLPFRVAYEPRANGTFRLTSGRGGGAAAAAVYDSATDAAPGAGR